MATGAAYTTFYRPVAFLVVAINFSSPADQPSAAATAAVNASHVTLS